MIRKIFLVCLAATLALNDEPCYCGLAKRINFGQADEAGDRIIGGESTEVNEYPWQALITMLTPLGTKICGGSLISDIWVLTAAHCLEPDLNIDVDLGEYNIFLDFETNNIEIKGDQQLIHPNFSK